MFRYKPVEQVVGDNCEIEQLIEGCAETMQDVPVLKAERRYKDVVFAVGSKVFVIEYSQYICLLSDGSWVGIVNK